MYEKLLKFEGYNVVIINDNKFVFCRTLNLCSFYILFCFILLYFCKQIHIQFDSLWIRYRINE